MKEAELNDPFAIPHVYAGLKHERRRSRKSIWKLAALCAVTLQVAWHFVPKLASVLSASHTSGSDSSPGNVSGVGTVEWYACPYPHETAENYDCGIIR